MLRTIDLRGTKLRPAQLRRVLPRGGTDVAAVVDKVAPMVHRVRQEGAAAALDYSELFDGVRPRHLRVPQAELDKAVAGLDPRCAEQLRPRLSASARSTSNKSRPHIPPNWLGAPR